MPAAGRYAPGRHWGKGRLGHVRLTMYRCRSVAVATRRNRQYPLPGEEAFMSRSRGANEQLLRRFYEEVWDKGNVEFAEEVFADDYVRHDLRPKEPLPGPQGQTQVAAAFRAAFPDLSFSVDLVFGDGEYVAARWTATGTNTGPWGGQSPSGRRVKFCGVNLFRFSNGKVVEIWNHRDDLGLMEQTGSHIYAGAPNEEQTSG